MVVSGLPNITPIFIRSWLIKMTVVLDLLIALVSFRRAWLIKRACNPMWESPMSPSISAFGVSAATESTTTTSMALERTNVSVISKACSPLSGWEIRRLSTSTPIFRAYSGSSACSASMKATEPPRFCASAIIWSVKVVFPELSGPKISTTRPRGTPPPNAISKEIEPVGIVSTAIFWASPIFMIAPLPKACSI